MKLLAFDTSTEAMSLGLQDGTRLWQHSGPGGAQASAGLIPAIQSLLAQGGLRFADLDAIVFGRGPGSFTGLRTACSVAQGLAFGAGIGVLPIDTLLAVAEQARHTHGATRVLAALDARMGEIYCARYEFDGARWRAQSGVELLRPEQLVLAPGWILAGNVLGACVGRLPDAGAVETLPTATAMLRLAPALLAAGALAPPEQALPLYIRDKVAQTTEERAATKAAAAIDPP